MPADDLSHLPPTRAGAHSARLTLLILCGAGMSFALAQTSVVPAIGALSRELDADASGVAWVLTGYLLCAAICTPIFGRLGDMFGKKRMLVVALSLFAAGNVVSALGQSLEVVVAGRVLQGTGGGTFPLCFAIIRDEFPPDRVRAGIGYVSAQIGIGGGVGLVLGGLLVDHFSYHWIYWTSAVAAATSAIAAHLLVPESPRRSGGRVDVRGAALFSVGMVAPLVALAEVNRWGWLDIRTLGLVGAGAVVLTAWVAVQRRTPAPLANVATLMRRPVLMTNIATLLTGGGMFGAYIVVPQLADAPVSTGYGFGATATDAGLLMLPGAALMLLAGPASGRMGGRLGGRVPLVLGAFLAAGGLALLAVAHDTQLQVMLWSTILLTGIGLTFAAMPNLIIDAVPANETGEATGFNALVRMVGAALGSQICGAVLAGSTLASGYPSERAFTVAFLFSAAVALLAAVVAMAIPSTRNERIVQLAID